MVLIDMVSEGIANLCNMLMDYLGIKVALILFNASVVTLTLYLSTPLIGNMFPINQISFVTDALFIGACIYMLATSARIITERAEVYRAFRAYRISVGRKL